MQHIELKNFGYLLSIITYDLRDWIRYSQMLQCVRYLKTGITLPSESLYG